MSAELTREGCADVAVELGLPHPGLVEKDFHVVRALGALSEVELEEHTLVFGGGTSLCRAYRMIERMSEDIDFRIIPASLTEGGRRRFRNCVTDALLAAGFDFDPSDKSQLATHDGGKTFVYHLPYVSVADPVDSLRPGIKVEISSWRLLMRPVMRPVMSFWAQARQEAAEVRQIACVDPAETAADKFVALTRRIAEERATGKGRDKSLLRHIYDLQRLRPALDLAGVAPMLRTIMESDRTTRGRNFPAYAADPIAVSVGAINALAADESYAQEFEFFMRDMVYGEKVSLAECLLVLREIAALLDGAAET